ncbi:xylose isomerase-like protein [Aspergillus heteromorphus CBS 117.55]|uniref:Xylose isomerase-like protein n=1 Tax=Aspergillus heteromorphus CBS 117.55 TaxID=1448321 RepID=A0A317UT77_9EURO|nr:xylose isomerase-like protein [Aspergillus heteromorphus CBS 117.55]PWY65214.1 xylose isomerase-like protein [Aspergillus heteromorphus CBS 117.55]
MAHPDVSHIPLSYATCSIGTPETTLPSKLSALSAAGFSGIELSFPDILRYAESVYNRPVSPTNYPELVQVATKIHELCDARNLAVMMLQPFANFEGWPRGSKEREDAFQRAEGWSEIMTAVGTDLLQVGSTDTPTDKLSPTYKEDIITDLQELADIFAQRKQRIAYENWCWSSHAQTWKSVWNIVSAVNRPNVGLCLDTFQTAGSEYGDPTTASGLIEEPSDNRKDLTERYLASLEELTATVPAEKIYLLQVSDAYRPHERLEKGQLDGMDPRARWSHSYRPVPYGGGYLPVEEVGRAVLGTGFKGWFSVEVFDGGRDGEEEMGGGKGEKEITAFAGTAMGCVKMFLGRMVAPILPSLIFSNDQLKMQKAPLARIVVSHYLWSGPPAGSVFLQLVIA